MQLAENHTLRDSTDDAVEVCAAYESTTSVFNPMDDLVVPGIRFSLALENRHMRVVPVESRAEDVDALGRSPRDTDPPHLKRKALTEDAQLLSVLLSGDEEEEARLAILRS